MDLTKKDWAAQIRKAAAATYAHVGAGTCIHVKVGTSGMEVAKVAENAIAAIDNLVQHVPRKWSNVQSIYMKTNESVALPVYNALPDPEEEKSAREEEAERKAEKIAAREKWRAEMEAERINTEAPPAKKKAKK